MRRRARTSPENSSVEGGLGHDARTRAAFAGGQPRVGVSAHEPGATGRGRHGRTAARALETGGCPRGCRVAPNDRAASNDRRGQGRAAQGCLNPGARDQNPRNQNPGDQNPGDQGRSNQDHPNQEDRHQDHGSGEHGNQESSHPERGPQGRPSPDRRPKRDGGHKGPVRDAHERSVRGGGAHGIRRQGGGDGVDGRPTRRERRQHGPRFGRPSSRICRSCARRSPWPRPRSWR